ncbi:ubiquitin carboxyl-terminal hydrolase [Musa troglodytarum]|uniref:Ubiquitin carboxyl-terminal hydrolase n=1 Tax=Musa troglodytarum TaxID=320322 RepID=A0A9E7GW98_9LILI|nr:ubiquitin carboxyl-terminal hydrolase [Musa troglodytarum]
MSDQKVLIFGSFTEEETRLFQRQSAACMCSLEKAGRHFGSVDFASESKEHNSSARPNSIQVSNVIADLACKNEPGKINNRLQTSKANGEAINSYQDDELMRKRKDTLRLVSPHITEKGVAVAELSASPKVQEGWVQASKANSISVDSSAIESPVVDIPKALADKAPNVKSILSRGLINSGNLCFLNATLQALLSCSLFVQLLQDLRFQSIPEIGYPTLHTFVEFISEFDMPDVLSAKSNVKVTLESGKSFSPIMFDAVLKRFTPDLPIGISSRPRQEDAQEFLSFIMDQMHDELLKLDGIFASTDGGKVPLISSSEDDVWETVGPKNRSAITRTQSFIPSRLSTIFGGQLRSVVKARGNKASATVQPFLLLHLDIFPESVNTIEDALHLFAAPETLEGYRTSAGKAGLVSACKSVKLQKLSKVMILHLMRFSYGSEGSTKLHKPVHFPLELVLGHELIVSPSSESRRYELVATITHHGQGPSEGHYTANAKCSSGRWLHYDDASVMAVTPNKVLHDRAYVLFYKQIQ